MLLGFFLNNLLPFEYFQVYTDVLKLGMSISKVCESQQCSFCLGLNSLVKIKWKAYTLLQHFLLICSHK